MKYLIIPLLLFCACSEPTVTEEETPEQDMLDVDPEMLSEQGYYDSEEIMNESEDSEYGLYGLISYFDSIERIYSVAGCRLQPPANFALLLDVQEDSIMSYGSILDRKYAVQSEDSLIVYDVLGARWWLRKNDDRLLLTQVKHTCCLDTNKYEYRKMGHLSRLLDTLAPRHQLSIGINKYFNQTLMAGDYATEDGLVTFHPNGRITGDFSYNSYQVRNYFGTSHPFQNYDVVMLYRKDTGECEYWHWKHNLEVLELTKLTRDATIIDHGEYIEQNDDFILTKEKMYLHRYV